MPTFDATRLPRAYFTIALCNSNSSLYQTALLTFLNQNHQYLKLVVAEQSVASVATAVMLHVSPRLAMQLQCAVTIFPIHSARIHGNKGLLVQTL